MPPQAPTAVANVPVIVFTLAGHPHAIPTESVQEVLRMVALTPLSAAPGWVAGMINLRGTPIVVIDLRSRFDLDADEYGLTTPIIVIRVADGRQVGLVVDAVTDLCELPGDAIFATGDGGLRAAVARIGSQLVNVADCEAIVRGTEQLLPAE